MDKVKIKEALVVEGRYDKNTLSQLVDAPIFVTNGFGIFKDPETLALLRTVAEKRGLIVLTDADGGGLVIRNHLKGTIDPALVKHAYIPDVPGKEKRKAAPGKEGKLGVEGMAPEVLLAALRNAGATFLDEATGDEGCGSFDSGSASAQDDTAVGSVIGRPPEAERSRQPDAVDDSHLIRHRACGGRPMPPSPQGEGSGRPPEAEASVGTALCRPPVPDNQRITKTDLYELGLSGRPDSREKRLALQKRLGLPENLSANALLTALNCIMTREDLYNL